MGRDFYFVWDRIDSPLNRGSIFSQRDSRRRIFSMARVGRLGDLEQGVRHPYYSGKRIDGYVEIPDEFYKLLSTPVDVIDIWYFGDPSYGSNKKDYAFEARLYGGGLEVPEVWVYFGVNSGILEIVVRSWSYFVCDPPPGFNIDSLVFLLNQGSLQDFVYNYGRLTTAQQSRLLSFGL